MKKILIGGLMMMFLSCSFMPVQETSEKISPEKELKVGDLMPDPTIKGQFKKGQGWINPYTRQAGYSQWYVDKKTGACLYHTANTICKGVLSKHIYGLFSHETNFLYLDNNPNNGKINKIIKTPIGRTFYEDMPLCPSMVLL